MGRILSYVVIFAAASGINSGVPANAFQSKAGSDAPPPRSIFETAVPKPTGNNAYEEYAKAADVMMEPAVQKAGVIVGSPPAGTPLLDAKRAWVAAGRRALEYVRAGNKKPISDPRSELTLSTLFPEMAQFRQIAKLLAAEARVKLADGNPAGAVQSLVDGLDFSERIGHYVLIGTLVGNACTQALLSETEEDLGFLSQKHALSLARAADALLGKPPAMIGGLEAEMRFCAGSIDVAYDEIAKAVGEQAVGETERNYMAEALALTPAQRESIRPRVLAKVRERLDSVIAVIQGPEKGWTEPHPDPAITNLIDWLADFLVPVLDPAVSATARLRTQLRLLRLHGVLISFLWEHRRLPEKLSELENAAVTDDPITGTPFHYEKTGEASYRLWSEGWGTTGRIELKYKRPPGAPKDDPKLP